MPSFISFVPTPTENIDDFFKLAQISSSDLVYDLGSGDGRLLFTALEKGAGRAIGVELDSELIQMAREQAGSKSIEDRVAFLEADVMDVNLTEATLVLCYLIPAASAALKPKFEAELKPGTRVVMESFAVPGWKPSRTLSNGYREFYLYVMPPEETDEYPIMEITDAGYDYLYGDY